MPYFPASSILALTAALRLLAQAPVTPGNDDASASATRGMPARATPADYQAHGAAGPLQLGAEFMQHSVPTPQGLLTTEDYVVVEAGLFGPPGSRTTVSFQDFSLRINEKKNPQRSEPYAVVFKSLKDPEWEADTFVEQKQSKTSIGSSGAGGKGNSGDPPPVVHVPIKLQREWEARATKAAFPEGDRTLPQAGLLFFQYRGKASGIHSLELIYSGPAGKAVLSLNP
ncbi:MAG TPA: hypothetical protein VNU44_10320 [Bryobacteraceae bacterium]|jgi:hypothetical protein|nr:hypothetical protein [Bryobacteraceae bacterium]